jgi:hypothetical protein
MIASCHSLDADKRDGNDVAEKITTFGNKN